MNVRNTKDLRSLYLQALTTVLKQNTLAFVPTLMQNIQEQFGLQMGGGRSRDTDLKSMHP